MSIIRARSAPARGGLVALLLLTAMLSTIESAASTSVDGDQDGVPDDVDNCVSVPNTSQLDVNFNGYGNACECGDSSGNGAIDTVDARLIQRCVVGQIPCGSLCDVNGDGACNTLDARMIQRIAVGSISSGLVRCDVKQTGAAPRVQVQSPPFGTFHPRIGVLSPFCVAAASGVVANISPGDPDVLLTMNGVPLGSPGATQFSTNGFVTDGYGANVFKASRSSTGATGRAEHVFYCGQSIAPADVASRTAALRISETALTILEGTLSDLLYAELIKTMVTNQGLFAVEGCFPGSGWLCWVDVDGVKIKDLTIPQLPSGHRLSVTLDARADVDAGASTTGGVRVTATVRNADLEVEIDLDNLPNPSAKLEVDQLEIRASLAFEPDPNDPTKIDVELVESPLVLMDPGAINASVFSSAVSAALACCIPGGLTIVGITEFLEGILDDFIFRASLSGSLMSEIADELGNAGPGESPISDELEKQFAEIDLNADLSTAFGAVVQARFAAIREDDEGISFELDSGLQVPVDQIDPTAPAPDRVASPSAALPNASDWSGFPAPIPYMAGLAVTPTLFNQILRADLVRGRFRSATRTVDLSALNGASDAPITTDMLQALFQMRAPIVSEHVEARVTPTTSPVVVDVGSTPGPLKVQFVALRVEFVGLTTGMVHLRYSITMMLGLDAHFDPGDLTKMVLMVRSIENARAVLLEGRVDGLLSSSSEQTMAALVSGGVVVPIGAVIGEPIALPPVLGGQAMRYYGRTLDDAGNTFVIYFGK